MGLRRMLKQLATPQMGDFAHLIAKAAREGQSAVIHKYHDILLSEQHARIRREHPNPFVRNGMKFFSQSDEDGITIEIIKRLGILVRLRRSATDRSMSDLKWRSSTARAASISA